MALTLLRGLFLVLGLWIPAFCLAADSPNSTNDALARIQQIDQQTGADSFFGTPKTSEPEFPIGKTQWITSEPDWLNKTPSAKELYFKAVTFSCKKPTLKECQQEAESNAKSALGTSISSEVETKGASTVTGQTVDGAMQADMVYRQTITEISKHEVREVGFVHYGKGTLIHTLAYMPKRDLFERSVEAKTKELNATLPTDLAVGAFFVNGEQADHESYISFYTGRLVQEVLAEVRGQEPPHQPNAPGEKKKDYQTKFQDAPKPILWGEFDQVGELLKLRLMLYEPEKKNSKLVTKLDLPFQGLVENLSKISRLSKESDLDAKFKKVVIIHVAAREATDFESPAALDRIRIELEDRLDAKGIDIQNRGSIQSFGRLKGTALSSKINEYLSSKPKTMALVITVSGQNSDNQGMLYHGMARADLNVSLYNPKGEQVLSEQREIKRFLVKSPKELSKDELKKESEDTITKGMDEFAEELSSSILEKML